MAGLSLLVFLLAAGGALAVGTGALTQPAGTAGCISEDGSGPCADGHAMGGPGGVAVSPDGKNVYTASGYGVARFDRTLSTGAITQPSGAAGCISSWSEPCRDGHAVTSSSGVAVSPDGKSVYVASHGYPTNTSAVVRLKRNTSNGAISQPAGAAGCISDDGSGPCADGHAIGAPQDLAVSPDGKNVYVASAPAGSPGAVLTLNRDTSTGAITQPAGTAGCISADGSGGECADAHGIGTVQNNVAVSPDGKSVYVASFGGGIVRFDRDRSTGALTQPAGAAGCISDDGSGPCADGHAIGSPTALAVSPDGKSVYVGTRISSSTPPGDEIAALVRLKRNTNTGAITQPTGTAGCISADGSGPCADGHGMLRGPYGVTVSPDGRSVYLTAASANALVRIRRNTTYGSISQPAGTAGCISEDGSGPCSDGRGLSFPTDVAVSPDGNSVYVAASALARFNRAP
ncbi:MAG: lactonase family protein [Solirubrobacterales bacterium]